MTDNLIQNIELIFLIEMDWVSISIKCLAAKSDDVFWGTFDIDPNQILVSRYLSDDYLSLVSLAEGKLNDLW